MAVRSVGAVLACAFLVFGISGCTEPSPPTVLPSVTGTASSAPVSSPPTSPTTSSPSAPTTAASTTPPSPDAKTQIIAQWQKYWTLLHSLQGKSLPAITDGLKPVATGTEAVQTAKTLRSFAAQYKLEKGPYIFGEAAVDIEGTQAFVTECRDETNLTTINTKTGTVIDASGDHVKYIGTMVQSGDGTWKLAAYDATVQSC